MADIFDPHLLRAALAALAPLDYEDPTCSTASSSASATGEPSAHSSAGLACLAPPSSDAEMNDTAKISAAFVKAQQAFGPALKTHTNPAFKSRYADLSACVEAVIDALNANGIGLMQRNLPAETGVCVETVFIHESGETLSSGPLHVPAMKQDPQGYGSALTYARRYSLMAACGIAPEDDDGNAAKPPAKKPVQRASGMPDNFKASGPAEALKLLPSNEQDYLKEVAMEILADWAKGEAEHVIWRIYDNIEAMNLEQEQKAGLWSLLPSDVRGWLGKEGKKRKEAE